MTFVAACSTDEPSGGEISGGVDTVGNMNQPQSSELLRLNEAIKENPNDANNHYKRALYLSEQQKYDLAINDLNRALAIDSTVAVFHFEIAEIYYKIAKPDEARFFYDKCLQFDEQNTDAMIKLAQIYFVYKDYKKAMNYINDALRIDEFISEGYYLKGWIYKETGDTALAVSSFSTARDIQPEFYDADIQLGLLYASANEDIAIQYYDAALTTEPKSVEALYNKGIYCQNRGYLDSARQCYRAIIDIEPNYVDAYYNQGYIFLNYDINYDSAGYFFDLAIQRYPEYYQAYYNRGLCYEAFGLKDSAAADFQRALDINGSFDLAAKGLSRLGL